jgi:hypothetical protein
LNIYDKAACRDAYTSIKSSVEAGLIALQEFRDNDPYSEAPIRVAYEAIAGEQAPTASLQLLNQ